MKLKKIGITCKSNIEDKDKIVDQIINFFQKNKVEVAVDYRIKKKFGVSKLTQSCSSVDKCDNCHLIIVLGGDGTMLRAIREHLCRSSIFFGINMGHLGFLAEISPKELTKTLQKILDEKYYFDERELLKIIVKRDGKEEIENFAVNEAVLNQWDISRLIRLRTEVNRRKLLTFYSDGLIIATPTGSTAYSLSAGGPLVHPEIPGIILTPITPHSFTQKPIVIPNNKKITIHTDETKYKLRLTLDGQESFLIRPGDIITVTKHNKKVSFLRLNEENYFKTLRRKLGWGERKGK